MNKSVGSAFTSENIYESALNLFLSLGWIERREQIRYIGESKWEVDASVSINFERLAGRISGDDFRPLLKSLRFSGWLLPIIELPKLPRTRYLEVCHSNGDRAWIAPDEISYTFAWMIIMGCIVKAVRSGYLNVPDESSWRPSKKLTDLILREIRNPNPSEDDHESFLGKFYKKLREEASNGNKLEEEYKKFAYYCPGFELLFLHFRYNQLYWVHIEKGYENAVGEVLLLRFTEYFNQYSNGTKKSVVDRLRNCYKALFGGSKLSYPLRRIGTGENVKFTIYSPDWTSFQPLDPRAIRERKNEIQEDSELYLKIEALKGANMADSSSESSGSSSSSERQKKSESDGSSDDSEGHIVLDAVISEDAVILNTYAEWDERLNQTRRRFEVFDNVGPKKAKDPDFLRTVQQQKAIKPDKTPKEGWGAYSRGNEHSYVLNIGWRARAGRRTRANLVFLFVSLLSVAFVAAYTLDCLGCIGIKYWNKPTLFTTLPIIVSTLVLVFSNLQEETPFYRKELMRLPRCLVRAGIACDGVAFISGLISPYFKQISIVLACISVAVILVAFVILLIWFIHNHERKGLNRFENIDTYIGPMHLRKQNSESHNKK